MFAKLVSAFLSLIFLVQTAFPAMRGAKYDPAPDEAALKNVSTLGEYIDYIQTYGAPAYDTKTFLKALEPFKILRTITSFQLLDADEDRYLNVRMSAELEELSDYVRDHTGMDVYGLFRHIPKSLGPLTALKRGIHPDFSEFRSRVYALSDEVRQNGDTALATLLYLFGMFFSVVNDIDIYTIPGKADGELAVRMDVTYADGKTETVDPDVVIDTNTMRVFSYPGYGIAGTGYEIELEDLLLYTVMNAWQRKFGFFLGYDLFVDSNPGFVYATRRFKFDYAGREWMIQVWKGNYALITNGGELGIYNREQGRFGTFYDAASDEDRMVMSLDILHGDELLVSRPPQLHWWVTGFKMMNVIYTPDSLTARFSVEMKDAEMLEAFTAAIDANVYHDVSYSVDGLTVKAVW